MPIYERPTKSLMFDWARDHVTPGQVFRKAAAVKWFAENYPKIKSSTVTMHVEAMAVNSPLRKHHPSIKSQSGHDLFYKLGPDQFRLWVPETDPAPFYKDSLSEPVVENGDEESADVVTAVEAAREFAFERDLRNYLVKHLGVIEHGLRLYDEEGISGVEFPAGGRFIDILAVDSRGQYVVIELKVSRGYDRVVGQLLRYMAWVEQNMDVTAPVRGIIVANHVTDDLRLASSRLQNVQLIEYEIAFNLRVI